MKKLAVPGILLLCLSSSAYSLDEVSYPRKSKLISRNLEYQVPSAFPNIQIAIDAAVAAGGKEITIIVEEGEYRETVVATGLKNLKLIGRNARILPPGDFDCEDPPAADDFSISSFKLINCENFRLEGFTFIGDDFTENTGQRYPMGNAILSYNSSGKISNNIIFNYFDGICFLVDNLKWMSGEISDNYIHNCIWSGIFATGSHNLIIQKNKIAFTIPKALSISVGIWTDGGTGIISGNHITSYRAVDYPPKQETKSGPGLWPANLPFLNQMDYQVMDNTFEQSPAGAQISKVQMAAHNQYRIFRKTHRVDSYFININRDNQKVHRSEMVMLRSE
jgi:hypothetical protein